MVLQVLTAPPAHWAPATRAATLLLALALSFSTVPQLNAASTVEWALRLVWAGGAVYGLHVVLTGAPGAKLAALFYLSVVVLLPPFGFACGAVLLLYAVVQRLLRLGDTLIAHWSATP